MSYPVISEAFRLEVHVMAARNDSFEDWKWGVYGVLCANKHDEDVASLLFYNTRFTIYPTGAFIGFEGVQPGSPAGIQDYIMGPVARVQFGFPSSNVPVLTPMWYNEYGNLVPYDTGYGSAPPELVDSELVSNLDFSTSDPGTVAFTTNNDIWSAANHFAGLSYNWYYSQTGPMPGGSTTKSVSLSYTANAGPVNYSGTQTFPLLDYQYYNTTYPPNQDWAFVYVDIAPVPIPNASSGPKPGTTYSRIKVTSGQFNHTAAQFFEYA